MVLNLPSDPFDGELPLLIPEDMFEGVEGDIIPIWWCPSMESLTVSNSAAKELVSLALINDSLVKCGKGCFDFSCVDRVLRSAFPARCDGDGAGDGPSGVLSLELS